MEDAYRYVLRRMQARASNISILSNEEAHQVQMALDEVADVLLVHRQHRNSLAELAAKRREREKRWTA